MNNGFPGKKKGRNPHRCRILSACNAKGMAGITVVAITDFKEGNCHDQVSLFKDSSRGTDFAALFSSKIAIGDSPCIEKNKLKTIQGFWAWVMVWMMWMVPLFIGKRIYISKQDNNFVSHCKKDCSSFT